MRLVKRVSGILEVHPESGKMWLNTPTGCILRVSNLNFENTEDKFSFIDISDNKAIFYKLEDGGESEFEYFIDNISDIILYEKKNLSSDGISKLYTDCKNNLLKSIESLKGENSGSNKRIDEGNKIK